MTSGLLDCGLEEGILLINRLYENSVIPRPRIKCGACLIAESTPLTGIMPFIDEEVSSFGQSDLFDRPVARLAAGRINFIGDFG